MFLCEELRYSFVLNTPQCAPEKLHGDALASPCPWSQGAKHRHHPEALRSASRRANSIFHASDTLMTTTPPSAKGLPVGGLATAVPTWRLCSQRLVNGASEQLLNLLDLRQSFIAPGTSHAVMTNRRGCYRTTEGRPLLQRDPDGHRRRPGLRLEIATGLALPLTLSGTQSHSPSSVRKRPGGHFA